MSDGSGLEEGELASEQAENQSPRAGDKRRPARVEPRGNKEHKRKVKKVQENKGTQQDYFDVYGPGVGPSLLRVLPCLQNPPPPPPSPTYCALPPFASLPPRLFLPDHLCFDPLGYFHLSAQAHASVEFLQRSQAIKPQAIRQSTECCCCLTG